LINFYVLLQNRCFWEERVAENHLDWDGMLLGEGACESK